MGNSCSRANNRRLFQNGCSRSEKTGRRKCAWVCLLLGQVKFVSPDVMCILHLEEECLLPECFSPFSFLVFITADYHRTFFWFLLEIITVILILAIGIVQNFQVDASLVLSFLSIHIIMRLIWCQYSIHPKIVKIVLIFSGFRLHVFSWMRSPPPRFKVKQFTLIKHIFLPLSSSMSWPSVFKEIQVHIGSSSLFSGHSELCWVGRSEFTGSSSGWKIAQMETITRNFTPVMLSKNKVPRRDITERRDADMCAFSTCPCTVQDQVRVLTFLCEVDLLTKETEHRLKWNAKCQFQFTAFIFFFLSSFGCHKCIIFHLQLFKCDHFRWLKNQFLTTVKVQFFIYQCFISVFVSKQSLNISLGISLAFDEILSYGTS